MFHLEEHNVSTGIRYKMCAQIFVLSVNKSPIRYSFQNAMEYGIRYNANMTLTCMIYF